VPKTPYCAKQKPNTYYQNLIFCQHTAIIKTSATTLYFFVIKRYFVVNTSNIKLIKEQILDFQDIHSINLNNEKERKKNGIPTFRSIFDGVHILDLKPNPLKCLCGNYPKIEKDGDDYHAICSNSDCKNQLYNTGLSYQDAIFTWNKTTDVEFNKDMNRIHPLLWFSPEFDSKNYLLKQIKQLEEKLSKIEKFLTSSKEDRLLRLIRSWNDYAIYIVNLKINRDSNPSLTNNPPLTKYQEDKTEKSEDSKCADPNTKYIPDIDIDGPMKHYEDEIQIIGDAYYWFVEGHLIRLKTCKHTNWTIPTYLVYVKNAGTNAGYQVRIDLRSIGVPYYSKMFSGSNLYGCLAEAIECLISRLHEIPHTKKNGNLIKRGSTRKRKNISLSDVKAIRLLEGTNDYNHRIEISFSSPNNNATARHSIHLGGKSKTTYKTYTQAINEALNLCLLHTKLSCDKKYSVGVVAVFSDLDSETQKLVSNIVSEHFDLPISDTAYHLSRLDPPLHIGYLTLSSLNKECTLDKDTLLMQVVSQKQRRGYVQGKVKRHDHLNNVDCVNIDAILDSNFDDYVYSPDSCIYKSGEPKLALLNSIKGVILEKERNNELRSSREAELMTPLEYFHYFQGRFLDKAKNNPVLKNHNIEFKEVDGLIHMYVDNVATDIKLPLDDWGGCHESAKLQCLVNADLYVTNNRPLIPTEDQNRDYFRRYKALGLSKEDIDLSEVRFVAKKESKVGLHNIKINKNKSITYLQKKGKNNEQQRRLFPAPKSESDFKKIIEDLYAEYLPFNENENKLIKHVYYRNYTVE
jgi:hypothetical protein